MTARELGAAFGAADAGTVGMGQIMFMVRGQDGPNANAYLYFSSAVSGGFFGCSAFGRSCICFNW